MTPKKLTEEQLKEIESMFSWKGDRYVADLPEKYRSERTNKALALLAHIKALEEEAKDASLDAKEERE